MQRRKSWERKFQQWCYKYQSYCLYGVKLLDTGRLLMFLQWRTHVAWFFAYFCHLGYFWAICAILWQLSLPIYLFIAFNHTVEINIRRNDLVHHVFGLQKSCPPFCHTASKNLLFATVFPPPKLKVWTSPYASTSETTTWQDNLFTCI